MVYVTVSPNRPPQHTHLTHRIQALGKTEPAYTCLALPGPPSDPHRPYPPGLVKWARSPHDFEELSRAAAAGGDGALWEEELDFALVVWEGAAFCRALVEDLLAGAGRGVGFGGGDREYAALDRGASCVGVGDWLLVWTRACPFFSWVGLNASN